MVTCGTYHKQHLINSPAKLELVQTKLLQVAKEFNWRLSAWAIMRNHYHFVGSPADPCSLSRMISKLHTLTAKELNLIDCTAGRRVWFQYYDSKITFTNSYLARIKYVNRNPEHHGAIDDARKYRWCSAARFERTACRSFRQTVDTFKIDSVNVKDDF